MTKKQRPREMCIVDTSIFVSFLKVPGKEDETIYKEFEKKLASNDTIFLPMTTIFETGNHIGQITDGNKRRIVAELYVNVIKQALASTPETHVPPFAAINFLDRATLTKWIADFPDSASTGKGFGDMNIVKDWEKLTQTHSGYRVWIWSKDEHLHGYDYLPTI